MSMNPYMNQSYPPSMYGTKNIKVVKFLLQETGTYNQQWKRPYISGLDAKTFGVITQRAEASKTIVPAVFAGIGNQFLQPAATPESHLVIPNGWSEKRFRFFLEVEIEQQMGVVLTEYVSGYTDYFGASYTNRLDPDMTFIINSINHTRKLVRETMLGNQQYHSSIDSSHILAQNNTGSSVTNKREYVMRPEDIIGQMDTAELQRTESLTDFLDTTTALPTTPIKSKRSNNIVPNYMANIIQSYVQANTNDQINPDRAQVLETAAQVARSPYVSEDTFLSSINKGGYGIVNRFKFADLINLDPNTERVTTVLSTTNLNRASLHQVGQTEDWGSSTGETVFSTSVSQALPGYMLEFNINKLGFRATNRDIGSNIELVVMEVKSLMTGVDITQYVTALVHKIKSELLMELSYCNQIDFNIEVKCDLIGETWINLSINGGPMIMYVTPSFCDALMSPMVTGNYTNCVNIAADFNNILDHISDNLYKANSPVNNYIQQPINQNSWF